MPVCLAWWLCLLLMSDFGGGEAQNPMCSLWSSWPHTLLCHGPLSFLYFSDASIYYRILEWRTQWRGSRRYPIRFPVKFYQGPAHVVSLTRAEGREIGTFLVYKRTWSDIRWAESLEWLNKLLYIDIWWLFRPLIFGNYPLRSSLKQQDLRPSIDRQVIRTTVTAPSVELPGFRSETKPMAQKPPEGV